MDIQQLISIDKDLLLQWSGSDSVFWDGFMWVATSTVIWIPAGLVLLYIIIKNDRPSKALFTVLMMAAVVVIAHVVASEVCKPYFARFRPTHDPFIMYLVDIVNDYRGDIYGFISGHATNTFSLSMFSSLVIRRKSFTVSMFAWAVLHTYTRIYLGLHYPGDILFGAIVGLIVGMAMYFLYRWLYKRLFPETHFSPIRYVSKRYVTEDLKVFYFTLILTLIVILLLAIWFGYRLYS